LVVVLEGSVDHDGIFLELFEILLYVMEYALHVVGGALDGC
jgi:hypothetical protein